MQSESHHQKARQAIVTFDDDTKEGRAREAYRLHTPLDMFFADRGYSIDQIRGLNQAIGDLVRNTKEKHDSGVGENLDLLRKVEIKYNQLVEWRDNFTNWEIDCIKEWRQGQKHTDPKDLKDTVKKEKELETVRKQA